MIIQQDYDYVYSTLYNETSTGVVVLREMLHASLLPGIIQELEDNERNFVRRPLYFGTTLQMLSSWDFERAVLKNYDYLFALEDRYAEISKSLHERMETSSVVDEVRVNVSRYSKNLIGIGPHRDNTFSVNFTVIFILSGSNQFCTAQNKEYKNEVCYDVRPGDCVILRGPRSPEEKELRPIHYVKEISSKRYIVTFREINHEYLHKTGRNRQYNA